MYSLILIHEVRSLWYQCEEFRDALFSSSIRTPWLVMFGRKWCTHCKAAEPELQMAGNNSYGMANFAYVDLGECEDIKKNFSIKTIPTYSFGFNGEFKTVTWNRDASSLLKNVEMELSHKIPVNNIQIIKKWRNKILHLTNSTKPTRNLTVAFGKYSRFNFDFDIITDPALQKKVHFVKPPCYVIYKGFWRKTISEADGYYRMKSILDRYFKISEDL